MKGNWAGDCGQPEKVYNLLNRESYRLLLHNQNVIIGSHETALSVEEGLEYWGLNVIRTKGLLSLENRS